MSDWQLQGDLLVFRALRLRVYRIGLSHWRPAARLRSWGVAPLHRTGDALQTPCREGEALWLGAWMDDDTQTAELLLTDAAGGRRAAMVAPPEFQLTGLRDVDGSMHPLVRPPDGARLDLALQLRCGPVQTTVALTLCAPDDWAALALRPAPPALTAPPPLPPRLG